MTAFEHRQYELVCDTPQLHSNYRTAYFTVGNGTSRAALRRLAVKAGWTHVRSDQGRKYDKDYCPEHAPEATS